jgi:hypothetical protein
MRISYVARHSLLGVVMHDVGGALRIRYVRMLKNTWTQKIDRALHAIQVLKRHCAAAGSRITTASPVYRFVDLKVSIGSHNSLNMATENLRHLNGSLATRQNSALQDNIFQ